MATTSLSVIGIPGKPHSFSPKTVAVASHEGLFTELSVLGTPGQKHSFLAKTPADVTEHTGLFTELSNTGTPGQRHSFLPKTISDAVEHTGLFTELSVLGIPGKRHSFLDKTTVEDVVAPILVAPVGIPTGSPGILVKPDLKFKVTNRRRILKEDDELMELVAQIVTSGILK